MDVQLTKDHQVVVYHDFETVITPRKVDYPIVYIFHEDILVVKSFFLSSRSDVVSCRIYQ